MLYRKHCVVSQCTAVTDIPCEGVTFIQKYKVLGNNISNGRYDLPLQMQYNHFHAVITYFHIGCCAGGLNEDSACGLGIFRLNVRISQSLRNSCDHTNRRQK